MAEPRKTRPVSWIRAALRDFEAFPEEVQSICLVALTVAAEGDKADLAKPMHGLGSGVFEIAARISGRCVQGRLCRTTRRRNLGAARAFQQKSKQGVKTPKREIDLVRDHLKR